MVISHIGRKTGLILGILLLSAAVSTAEPAKIRSLPMPARLVLAKVGPMLQKKQYGRAIETLRAFQARGGPAPNPGLPDPKGYHHPEIDFTLGSCHQLRGDNRQAAAAYRRAVARDPSHSRAWLNLAKAAYDLNAYAEAGRAFVQGYASAGGKTPEHLYYGAAAHLMADDPVRAVDLFGRLSREHPRAVKPEWKEHYVHALLAAGRPRLAIPVIRDLARLYTGEKKIQWQETLLYQYLEFNMTAEGLALARDLTRQAPAEPRWWKAMAHIQLDAGRAEDALVSLTIYSFLTPLSPKERRLMADLSLQVGVPDKAVPLYEAALKDEPSRDLLRNLIHGYRLLGRPEEALARLDAFHPDPGDAELLMLKGDLLYALARYQEAAEVFRRAARKGGKTKGRAWLMAGYAAWRGDDLSASREAFIEAARHGRQKKAADEALRSIRRMSEG